MLNAAVQAVHRRKKVAAIAAGCIATLLVAACSSSSSKSSESNASPAAGSQVTSLKIGYVLPNMESVALLVGAKKGIFAKYGLKVTPTSLGASSVVTSGLTSGSVDYAIANATQLITSVSKGADIIAVSGYTLGTGTEMIFSKQLIASKHLTASMPVSQLVHALQGGTVGLSSSAVQTEEEALLKSYGMSSNAVKTLTVNSEATLTGLLKSGQLDAFIAGPPVPEEAASDGVGTVLVTSKTAPVWNAGNANQVVAANKPFAAAHTALTKQVVEAFHAAVEYVIENPAQAASLAATLLQAPSAAVQTGLPLAGYTACGHMSAALWKKTLQYGTSSGALPATASAAEGTAWTNDYVTSQGC